MTNVVENIKNKMIKRLIKYLVIERKTEYIQYESSSKSNNARNYTNYSTLKTIRLKFQQKKKQLNDLMRSYSSKN